MRAAKETPKTAPGVGRREEEREQEEEEEEEEKKRTQWSDAVTSFRPLEIDAAGRRLFYLQPLASNFFSFTHFF